MAAGPKSGGRGGGAKPGRPPAPGPSAGPARLQVRLTPRSSRDRILGWDGSVLKIALTAPPVDNQANQSLLRFLAKALDLRAGDLSIERGAASRLKTVAAAGVEAGELEARLRALAGDAGGEDGSADGGAKDGGKGDG